MIDDWLVIFAGVIGVFALAVALNLGGAAGRMAEGNRRHPRRPGSISVTMPAPHPGWYSTDVRKLRVQATLTAIAALVTIVIGVT